MPIETIFLYFFPLNDLNFPELMSSDNFLSFFLCCFISFFVFSSKSKNVSLIAGCRTFLFSDILQMFPEQRSLNFSFIFNIFAKRVRLAKVF